MIKERQEYCTLERKHIVDNTCCSLKKTAQKDFRFLPGEKTVD